MYLSEWTELVEETLNKLIAMEIISSTGRCTPDDLIEEIESIIKDLK